MTPPLQPLLTVLDNPVFCSWRVKELLTRLLELFKNIRDANRVIYLLLFQTIFKGVTITDPFNLITVCSLNLTVAIQAAQPAQKVDALGTGDFIHAVWPLTDSAAIID